MRHRFKPHEWPSWLIKRTLEEYIIRYRREFGARPWTLKTMEHFFELYPELYKESFPCQHHFRCLSTILGLRGVLN